MARKSPWSPRLSNVKGSQLLSHTAGLKDLAWPERGKWNVDGVDPAYFGFEPGKDGRIEYFHNGLRAYPKIELLDLSRAGRACYNVLPEP
jgi:hypothetical protein